MNGDLKSYCFIQLKNPVGMAKILLFSASGQMGKKLKGIFITGDDFLAKLPLTCESKERI